jgi:transposase InsO family protein
VLDRHGLVEHARARRPRATGMPLSEPTAANDLWCADFKGEFRLGNGKLCYPLTVTDQVSRFILMVEALEGTSEAPGFTAFHRMFEERCLPLASAASTASRSSQSGGCASASPSSASLRAGLSRTAAASACTAR